MFFHLLKPCSAWMAGRALPVSGRKCAVKASMDRRNACETGVSMDNRQMWTKCVALIGDEGR